MNGNVFCSLEDDWVRCSHSQEINNLSNAEKKRMNQQDMIDVIKQDLEQSKVTLLAIEQAVKLLNASINRTAQLIEEIERNNL